MASDYNGYNVSCSDAQDGAIDMTVTGGVPPYHIEWSNGDTIEDLSGLSDGYYHVRMVDLNGDQAQAEITLTRPERFNISVTPSEYPNGYSISCNSCYNGSIDLENEGGVAPYTYFWDDAVTTPDRTALGAGNYHVVATDANGCETESAVLYLNQPERDDWGKSGNAGTNPAAQYIGTSDNKDVVFKTNSTERFRLLANGDVKISGLGDGLLRSTGGVITVQPLGATLQGVALPYWATYGNYLAADPEQFLGTRDANPLSIRTNDTQRMLITTEGKVGIGNALNTVPGFLTIRAGWNDWITLQNEEGGNDIGAWHFANTAQKDRLMIYYTSDGETAYSDISLWNNGKVSIGDVNIVTPDYEYALYVWKGILTERVKVALKTTSQWSDHVLAPNYGLMPLNEVEQFIARNGHLPNVPSAECMVEDGLDVVATDAMLLEKIEELTLHSIALAKRLGEMERRLAELTARQER